LGGKDRAAHQRGKHPEVYLESSREREGEKGSSFAQRRGEPGITSQDPRIEPTGSRGGRKRGGGYRGFRGGGIESLKHRKDLESDWPISRAEEKKEK